MHISQILRYVDQCLSSIGVVFSFIYDFMGIEMNKNAFGVCNKNPES